MVPRNFLDHACFWAPARQKRNHSHGSKMEIPLNDPSQSSSKALQPRHQSLHLTSRHHDSCRSPGTVSTPLYRPICLLVYHFGIRQLDVEFANWQVFPFVQSVVQQLSWLSSNYLFELIPQPSIAPTSILTRRLSCDLAFKQATHNNYLDLLAPIYLTQALP
jgi:hypothetical protein